VILVFLVALSRIYLGVHWPVDVIASVILGTIVSFIFCTLVDRYFDDTLMLRKIFFRLQAAVVFISIALFFADLFFLKGSMKITDFFKITGISTGAVYGFFIEERYIDFSAGDANIILKIVRFITGLAATIGIMTGLKIILPGHHISDFIRYAIVGAWVTLFWPAAGLRLRLFNRRSRVE
jgi:undecaprenyl-diphosphatase